MHWTVAISEISGTECPPDYASWSASPREHELLPASNATFEKVKQFPRYNPHPELYYFPTNSKEHSVFFSMTSKSSRVWPLLSLQLSPYLSNSTLLCLKIPACLSLCQTLPNPWFLYMLFFFSYVLLGKIMIFNWKIITDSSILN